MICRFVCCFLFLARLALAQQYNFYPVTADPGLPSSECHSVRQDSKQYLWISTDAGLAKFNGRTFKNFTTANGLTDNTVYDTWETDDGKLFYSASNSRLGYIRNDSAFTLPITDTLATILGHGKKFVTAVGDYDASSYILATQIGFFLLDKKTLRNLVMLPWRKDLTFWVKIINGRAYTAYQEPLLPAIIRGDSYQLLIESGGKQSFLSVIINTQFSGLSIFKSLVLKDGRVLIGFWDKLIVFYPDGHSEKMKLPSRLTSFYEDRDGGLWISLLNYGIDYYPSGKFTDPQHLLEKYSPSSVCMDAEEGIWVSTMGGGLLHCASLGIMVYPEEKDLTGRLYALSKVGSCVVTNALNDQVYIFRNKNEYRQTKLNIPTAAVQGMYKYTSHATKIYACGIAGSFILDSAFNLSRPLVQDNHVIGPSLYDMVNGEGNSLYGIDYKEVWRIHNDTASHFENLPSRGRDLALDGNGILYLATNNGLYTWDGDSMKKITELSQKINRVKCDSAGNIWACTDGSGVAEIRDGKIVRRIDQSSGLSSGICYDVAFDKFGNVWIATNNGLCGFNLQNPSNVKLIRSGQGLLSDEILLLAVLDNDLYIATRKGLCVAGIAQLNGSRVPPPVYLIAVRNDNLPAENCREFACDQNNFTFQLEGISYQDASGLTYRYRLLGLDSAWKTTRTGDISFNNLDDGSYRFEAVAVTTAGVASEKPVSFSFHIAAPFWKKAWFILLVLFSCGGLIRAITRRRIRNIRTKEKEKTALNKMIAEYQMSALRAQMHPHFIFNAINSIQHYILNNESQAAYDYLAKFSKLIRELLINSQHNLIRLEKEMELLELYIQLEQERFSNRFSYEIRIAPSVRPEEIRVPVMLIQPFVENAIWHGIMHLDEKKKGRLLIAIDQREDELVFTVEDNGVGRANAEKLQKNGEHTSMGMLLSRKRMDTIRAMGHPNARMDVIDLEDAQGMPAGTRIVIYFPLES